LAQISEAVLASPEMTTPAQLTAKFSPAAYERRQTHGAVKVVARGKGAQRVYIFVPQQPRLMGKVPVIFFHHGWQGMSPLNFGALIDHLARSGNIVIYPVYQDSATTSPQVVTSNAIEADRAAVSWIEDNEGLLPDPGRILYVGYSMGAAISLNLAIRPDHFGLPAPNALLLLAPGDAYHVTKGDAAKSIIGQVETLPDSLPVAVMTGSADTTIGLPTARLLFARMCGIRPDRRVLMVLPSDQHGGTEVHSGHGAPGAPDSRYDFASGEENFPRTFSGHEGFEASASLNQLDYYGFWKVLDALVDSLPTHSLPDVVFGQGTPEQLFLGAWPDGTAYKPIQLENPCLPSPAKP
jgi:pimeloyl-ACP methyl ester carboxylesterase